MAYYADLVSTVELLKEMSLSEHHFPKSLFQKQLLPDLCETLSHLQELLEDYSPNDEEAPGFLDRIKDAASLAQDILGYQIPDEACRERKNIESLSVSASREETEIIEDPFPTAEYIFDSEFPNAAPRAEHIDAFDIPDAVYRAENIIKSEISDQIREPNCSAGIIHIVFWQFVSACHSSEHVKKEEIVFTIRKGYQDLLELTEQLGSIFRKGYQDLLELTERLESIGAEGYTHWMMMASDVVLGELDPIALRGYQDLLKLKQKLDMCRRKWYLDLKRVKKAVDSVVGRGKQDLDRLKEEIDVIVGERYNYVLEEIKEKVDSIVGCSYEGIEEMKQKVDSIVGCSYERIEEMKQKVYSSAYLDTKVKIKEFEYVAGLCYFGLKWGMRELGDVAKCGNQNMGKVKQEVDSIVGRGYQDLKRMKEEFDSYLEKKRNQVLECVKEEFVSFIGKGYRDWDRVKREVDYIMINGYQYIRKQKEELDYNEKIPYRLPRFYFFLRRQYQDLERLKEEFDVMVEKEYKDILEKVKEEIDSIVEDLTRVKESHTTHQDDLQVNAGASTQGPSGGTTMVGFEQHLTKLKAQLLGDSSGLEIISIVGMGGVGKTTLGRNIFYDKLMYDEFEFRVWVTVSQSYHLRNILVAIANSLKIKIDGVEDRVLKTNIYQHLLRHRYLIIMDDVWDLRIWDDVKWIFPNDNESRSRILITTRQSDVASIAGESDFINQIPTLTHHQSWTLFCEKVHCPPELEDIGRLIVEKCGGIPLAIVVVAGLLSKVNTRQSDWKEVAGRMSSAAAENDESFSKILSLSYNYLPLHLKPCFLYFGGFPEDYEISVSKLVKLWVAEGFLKPIPSKGLEEVAEEYLEELVRRNLVLITKWRSNGKFKYCSIHDLLRDLCSERGYHEKFLLLPHKHSATGHIHRFFLHPDSSPKSSMPKCQTTISSKFVLFFPLAISNFLFHQTHPTLTL